MVLFVTCSKPTDRSTGGGLLCNTTFHFDCSPTPKWVIHGLLRSERTSMIPDLAIAECRPNHSSQSCPSCTQQTGIPTFYWSFLSWCTRPSLLCGPTSLSSLVWIRVLHQCEWFGFRFWVAKMCIFTGFWEKSVFVVFVCAKRRPS